MNTYMHKTAMMITLIIILLKVSSTYAYLLANLHSLGIYLSDDVI